MSRSRIATTLDRWQIFVWICSLYSVAILVLASQVDLASRDGQLFMIRLTVRCALPWFLLAFCASSIHTLWPSAASRWLLARRRYIGLAFALTFTWQLLFIVWLAVIDWPFARQTFLSLGGLGGAVGYSLLGAMALTSFDAFSRRLSRLEWRVLHKAGMYLLWALFAFSYGARTLLLPDLTFKLAAGTLVGALALRAAARLAVLRRRRRQPTRIHSKPGLLT